MSCLAIYHHLFWCELPIFGNIGRRDVLMACGDPEIMSCLLMIVRRPFVSSFIERSVQPLMARHPYG